MPPTLPAFPGALIGRHLGVKPITPDRRAKLLPLRHFVELSRATVPAAADWSAKAKQTLSQMMGNDREGDCVAVTVAKQIGVHGANSPTPSEVTGTEKEVLKWYHAVGGAGDNGLYVPDALDYARDTGMMLGGVVHRIDGYAAVDATDVALVNWCVYHLGGLHIAVELPELWYQRAGDDDVWGVTNTQIIGGHSVPITAYDPTHLRLATWGKQPRITRDAFHSRRWVTECYAVLGQDWYDDGLDTHGVNVSALKAALEVIRAGGTPVIPPDPNPPPPPPVPPPVPGGQTITLAGALSVMGASLPITLQGALSGSAPLAAAADWSAILKAFAQLTRALLVRDWPGVIAAALQILTLLGVSLTPGEEVAFRARLTDALGADKPPGYFP